MSWRATIVVLIVLISTGLLVTFLQVRRTPPTSVGQQRATAEGTPSILYDKIVDQTRPPATYSQLPASISGKYDSTLPQWQEYEKRNREDKKWEWKTQMAFYGRVVDQNNEAVAGATVELQWTDLSITGTSKYQTISDATGLFKMENAQGKNLGVIQLRKQGYILSPSNRRNFEYAAFFDKTYHLPDPNNPVIFRMYKRGASEPLIVRSGKMQVPDNGSVKINLLANEQDESNSQLIIDLLSNSDRTGRSWNARLRVPSGGIQQTAEEFATLAPESGYQPEITIDQTSHLPDGQSGNLYKGGRFYLQTPSGYAVIDIQMVAGNNSLRFSSYLNPNPTSRNLEHDQSSKKAN
jgi:hypothetical protein